MDQFLFMLIILNPFAQLLYLSDLINQVSTPKFTIVHFKATLLSAGVFILFFLFGEILLHEVFQVRFSSLQIFGGVIMLLIGYRYVADGAGSNLLFRGDISDIAPRISLPYMVGPGTIWASMLVGRQYNILPGIVIILSVLAVNFLFVVAASWFFSTLQGRKETMLGKYFAILMRTNALFIGAIAVEMIVSGIALAYSEITGDNLPNSEFH